MDLHALTRPAKPWLHLLAAPVVDAWDALRALEATGPLRVVVRAVRGSKSGTAAAFFDEIAAAMQMPTHFGENWDALADCLNDLAWLRADAVVLVVLDAGRLLDGDTAAAAKFAAVIADAVRHRRPSVAPPLHVVLQAEPAAAAVAGQHWHQLGLTLHRMH